LQFLIKFIHFQKIFINYFFKFFEEVYFSKKVNIHKIILSFLKKYL
jgi:hypothetical protein